MAKFREFTFHPLRWIELKGKRPTAPCLYGGYPDASVVRMLLSSRVRSCVSSQLASRAYELSPHLRGSGDMDSFLSSEPIGAKQPTLTPW
jgi:hypothetical protein